MLPFDFVQNIQQQLGALEANALCKALESEPVTSIRLNDKIDQLSFDTDTSDVPWHEDGYYLAKRPQFTLDPLLHAGCYYVQEASSMFLEEVLLQYVKPDSIVLDLCAAPGGKSTLISQFLGQQGILISNEIVRQRVFILSENIQKWGNGNTIVTHNPPKDFGEKLPNLFDCILIDAPCSGEGMFRKDPDTIKEWSKDNVRVCAERQRSIVQDTWEALKPGGILIYSTCTFNQQENEQNVLWVAQELGAEILPITYHPSWGITEGQPGYHFFPHKTKGEGLYICALRKDTGNDRPFRIPKTKNTPVKTVEQEDLMRSWLQHPQQWTLRMQDRFITAYPTRHKQIIEYISTQFICICFGVGMGEQRGKTIVPQHPLAMAKDFKKDAFPQIELTREQALNFLRTETISFDNKPTDILLVTYQHVPLGFVKNVGNHCNNFYPKEWRIRKL